MPQQDASLHVHSLFPLVRDAGTGLLRFARLGIDEPSTFVRDPSALPDAALDLFVFEGDKEMRHWIAGVREVSSNAVEVVVPDVSAKRFCLLVRHDRERSPGATLDEVVTLRDLRDRFQREDVAAMGSRIRSEEAKSLAAGRSRTAFDERWADEIREVRKSGFLEVRRELFGVEDVGVMRFDGTHRTGSDWFAGRLEMRKSDAGYDISWFSTYGDADEDLREAVETLAAGRGLSKVEDGFALRSPTFDVSVIRRVREDWKAVEAAIDDAKATTKQRAVVLRDYANAALRKLVSRSVAGFLPVVSTNDFSCRQVSPTRGNAIEVPATHVRRAIEAGYLGYVWAWGRYRDVDSAVLDVTDAGRAFDAERFDDVVSHFVRNGTTPVAAMRPAGKSEVTLAEAVRRRDDVSPRSRKALEDHVALVLRDLESWAPTHADYAVFAACLALGVGGEGLDAFAGREPRAR